MNTTAEIYSGLIRIVIIVMLLCAPAYLNASEITLSFRDSVSVNDSLIHLADIAVFKIDGDVPVTMLKATVAGVAAPPGYSRLITVSDLILYRIQPMIPQCKINVQGKKRITVHTNAISISIKQKYEILTSYLDSALLWKKGEWTFSILNDTLQWKGYDAPYTCTVSGLQSGMVKGKVQLKLTFSQGNRKMVLPVHCFIGVTTPVLVAKVDIGRGDLLSSENCQAQIMDITGFAPEPFNQIEEVAGTQAAMTIKAGSILQKRIIQRSPDVIKGDHITIVFNKGRVTCTIQGIARETGVKGDKIWVENGTTQQLLRVVIIGKGQVALV